MAKDRPITDGGEEGEVRAALRPIQRVLRERPTMEHVLLLLFLVVGSYMFWEAREFSPAAAEFPRLMAGATAVLAFLILVRNYLKLMGPVVVAGLGLYWLYGGGTAYLEAGEGLFRVVVGAALLVAGVVFRKQVGESAESFVAEPMQVLGEEDVTGDVPTDEGDATEADEEESNSGAMYVYEIDDPRGPVVTGVLCVVYMLLTFSIGMLYASPLFVGMWALWVRMDAGRAAALVGISFVTAYAFYEFISSDIAEGWITGWEPTPPDELPILEGFLQAPIAEIVSWSVIVL